MKTRNPLHVVSFDVPFPADYGGAIDVYYKLEALHQMGFNIWLHCFEYGRKPSAELEKICEKVSYYKRKNSVAKLFSTEPFIVNTRTDERLLSNLIEFEYPILFEGLHCCAYLNHPLLKKRKKIVRTHNVEHTYYQHLSYTEKNLFKRLFFQIEAIKLKSFEKIVENASALVCISPNDKEHFKQLNAQSHFITAFHPNQHIRISDTVADYCLYHGSLGVGENNKAALWLVEHVFNHLDLPLIIAGNNPSEELRRKVNQLPHVSLISGISTPEILALIQSARINVLPTFQGTGIKLKLLAALFNGKHCVVNDLMIENTGLESLCHIANSPEEMIKVVMELYQKPFDNKEIQKREQLLTTTFSNKENAKKLADVILQ